jgi:flagellar basal-body rod modification protein FlgD
MSVNGVNNNKTLEEIIDSTTKRAQERKTGELGKDDFLNLLITQLRYQDPMNPVDDKEFIGQMAQFSTLEQMQNMNGSISSTKAFGMIGKHISANIVDDATLEIEFVEGLVESVKMEGGKTFVIVNGHDVPVERVISVSNGHFEYNDSNISQYTGIIGYEAKGAVYDPDEGDMISINGVVREISKGRYENYAVMDGVSVRIAAIDTDIPVTGSEFRKNYLADNIDKAVSVIITDDNGKQVPVKGILKEFEIQPDGKITAVINGINVPVESIYNIKEATVIETNADSVTDRVSETDEAATEDTE